MLQRDYMMINPQDIVIDMPCSRPRVDELKASIQQVGIVQPIALWLLLCVACVVLWVLPPPVEEPPAPPPMRMTPTRINGVYQSRTPTAQRSRHIRAKYRSPK